MGKSIFPGNDGLGNFPFPRDGELGNLPFPWNYERVSLFSQRIRDWGSFPSQDLMDGEASQGRMYLGSFSLTGKSGLGKLPSSGKFENVLQLFGEKRSRPFFQNFPEVNNNFPAEYSAILQAFGR